MLFVKLSETNGILGVLDEAVSAKMPQNLTYAKNINIDMEFDSPALTKYLQKALRAVGFLPEREAKAGEIVFCSIAEI